MLYVTKNDTKLVKLFEATLVKHVTPASLKASVELQAIAKRLHRRLRRIESAAVASAAQHHGASLWFTRHRFSDAELRSEVLNFGTAHDYYAARSICNRPRCARGVRVLNFAQSRGMRGDRC